MSDPQEVIEPGYWDIDGTWHETPAATRRALLAAMRHGPSELPALLPAPLPATAPATAPATCTSPGDLGIGRAWGVTCQVYGLRSARNAGIGDLEDVADLAERLAAVGADFLGLSPLHALFPEDPGRCSPYAPSSRRWLSELLIAVDRASDDLGLPPVEIEGASALHDAELIDYAGVAAAKAPALEALWAAFRSRHLDPATTLGDAFLAWREAAGQDLERLCRFQALAEATPPADWPDEYRAASAPAVERLAREHAGRVAYRAFLQWVGDRQLGQAQVRARAAGMRIGLYCDLAVGVVPDGAEAWADPEGLVIGAMVGAPPDPFSPQGQNWNVVAPSPVVMQATDAAPLRATLRAAMRHAGAVRIDHVLALMRLFLIPPGGRPLDGTYVRYPFDRLLHAVAEESLASGCIVVGEDLGTVPDGFRPRMQAAGLLGYRVLWLERDWPRRDFLPPDRYPAQALATVSTHDLATVRGFLAGRDLDWRERLGHLAGDRLAAERATRRRDIERLGERLRREGLLDGDGADAWSVALHRLLARTPSSLVAVQLEDLAGEVEQANLPGTIDEHPNWRRRLSRPVGEVLASPLAGRILDAIRAERPR
jgi:4-alpha-glucanotransferase